MSPHSRKRSLVKNTNALPDLYEALDELVSKLWPVVLDHSELIAGQDCHCDLCTTCRKSLHALAKADMLHQHDFWVDHPQANDRIEYLSL